MSEKTYPLTLAAILGKPLVPGDVRNSDLVIRALVELAIAGDKPTADEVVDYVYLNYRPARGWIEFDRDKWLRYVPEVHRHLTAGDIRAARAVTP